MTKRQMFWLLKKYRIEGAALIRYNARGRTANNVIHAERRDYALALIKEKCDDFGPTLVAEILAERDGFIVTRETLRK